MKQLSSSELYNMSKEEMAAMILQMQQTQLQLQQQVHTLTEKIAIMNARHFGRSTEKLDTLPGQMNIFNETEVAVAEAIAEPAIEQVVIRRKKQKGKRKEDLSRLPRRIENHELTKEQLKAIFGDNGWKRLPDEVYSRVEYQPAVREVVEHHVAVYAAKKADVDTIVRADRPVDLLRNSIATPSLVAAVMNAKYTNAIPLYRIAQDFEQNDMLLSRATMANWVIRCSERYLSLVYDRLREHLCKQDVIQADETTCQVTKDGRSSDAKSYMFVYRTSELSDGNPVVLYQYGKTRSKSNIQRFLNGFSGTLVSDAYSGYKALDKEEPDIRAAFCWAHARRDYADALKALKGEDKEHASETVAYKALVQIAAIYKADAALKDKSAADRYLGRQKEVKPLLAFGSGIGQNRGPFVIKGLLCDPGSLVGCIHRYELHFFVPRRHCVVYRIPRNTVVDIARRHFHAQNKVVLIAGSMGFVGKLPFMLPFYEHSAVRIGGRNGLFLRFAALGRLGIVVIVAVLNGLLPQLLSLCVHFFPKYSGIDLCRFCNLLFLELLLVSAGLDVRSVNEK